MLRFLWIVRVDKTVACILTGPLGKPTHSEMCGFITLIPDMMPNSDFLLSSFISDIFGVSGRNIVLHQIVQGQIDGVVGHYDSLKEHLAEIERSLNADMAPFALQVEQLNSIYGISTTASCVIIAEFGIDMKPFKTAEHIWSWAGLYPSNNESAGKRNIYLSAWYWRIKQKKGTKKAIVAFARKLLVIIYTMFEQGTLFDESCFEARCSLYIYVVYASIIYYYLKLKSIENAVTMWCAAPSTITG